MCREREGPSDVRTPKKVAGATPTKVRGDKDGFDSRSHDQRALRRKETVMFKFFVEFFHAHFGIAMSSAEEAAMVAAGKAAFS